MPETILNINDTLTITDSRGRTYINGEPLYEKVLISEVFHWTPYKIPLNTVPILELFNIDSIRIGTITDWQFSPDYKVLFDDGNGYATTSWHNNIQSYGQVTKTSKHWAGEYTVGNWEVELNDPNGDIWGSLYNFGSEARGKTVLLRAMIQDRPLTYVSQFEGQIQDVTTENGKITLLVQDMLGGLNNRQFVWDYYNIGSANASHVWGRVKQIFGTQVMWDDYGDIQYIERKSPSTSIWSTGLSGIVGGVIGFIGGGPVGAIMGFAGGVAGNMPKSSQVTNAYYKYTDYNAIPDDTVASGQKVKFFAGSICAIATNSNSPLQDIQEKIILGGQFENGILGTFEFADTSGIKVGDWVYARAPIIFTGSPDKCIKQILCGSNINIPYNANTTYDVYGNLISNSSFNSQWGSEISNLDLMSLSRTVGISEEISPLDLLKELLSEVKINFYIDENNKFACRTIRPRGINLTNVATYTNDTNIMNFQYKRSTSEAQNGFIMYYDWVGQNGAYNDEYNKRYILNFKNPIVDASKYGTINSKWIHKEEDARTIAYHIMFDTELGIDRGVLDTTLYGVIQNVSDVVRVTHPTGNITNNLFEIESYSKDFTSSKVQLSLIDAQRIYGYGNCVWVTNFANVTGSSLSGYSVFGQIGSQVGTFGTINAVLSAFATTLNLDYYIPSGWYCCFGSLTNQYTEVVYVEQHGDYSCLLQRGLFNTISRKYNIGDTLYSICPASRDSNGNLIPSPLINKFNLGTTYGMNPLFGTSFKFF